MNRRDIGFFKAIIESYEDVAIFSVLHGGRGIIDVVYPAFFEETLLSIIDDMNENGFIMQEVSCV